MVGFARVISDQVTIAYLTDVYVLKEHQGKGLGRWMLERVNEVVERWPFMRGLLVMTEKPETVRLYNETLGAADLQEGDSAGLFILEKPGPMMKAHP